MFVGFVGPGAHYDLGNALWQAVKWRLLVLNPAGRTDLPPHQRDETIAMTEGEAARYLAAAASSQYHVLLASLLSMLKPRVMNGGRCPRMRMPT